MRRRDEPSTVIEARQAADRHRGGRASAGTVPLVPHRTPSGVRSARASGKHEIRLDDRDPEQNAIADALIAYLVRFDLAESRSEETEPGHYDYFISVDWDPLYRVAESAGIDLPAALARAASIPGG